MREIASVLCVSLALGSAAGCAAHHRRSAPPADPSSNATLHYAAASPGARGAGGAGSPSHGSASFGNFVRAREPQLQFCYREARAKSPDLVGSATVAVTLADDGGVVDAKILRRSWSTPSAARVVENCMLDKVRAWRFPAVDPRDEHSHSFAVIFSS